MASSYKAYNKQLLMLMCGNNCSLHSSQTVNMTSRICLLVNMHRATDNYTEMVSYPHELLRYYMYIRIYTKPNVKLTYARFFTIFNILFIMWVVTNTRIQWNYSVLSCLRKCSHVYTDDLLLIAVVAAWVVRFLDNAQLPYLEAYNALFVL